MKGPRDRIEELILMSIGAAYLTRERAEAVVGDLVDKGQVGADEGRQAVDELMARVRKEAPDGLVGLIESGLGAALKDLGVTTRGDLDDISLRLNEIDHRLRLLEARADEPPG